MSDLEKNMVKLKEWIEIDVHSPKTRSILTEKINYHIDHPELFSPTLYEENKDKFSQMGQTAIELTKLSKNWSKTITPIKAICKFKRLLKKSKNDSTEE